MKSQVDFRNQLLGALSPDDFQVLLAHLQAVPLPFGMDLANVGRPMERVYFPESGIISVAAGSPGVGKIGIGVIGWEGMAGLGVVLGDRQSTEDIYVQVAGKGHAIETASFAAVLNDHPRIFRKMLAFARAFASQVAQTALVNGRSRIEVRLARWLLMAADRIGPIEMPLTHEQMAVTLGVRRPGVTDALHRLEGEHLITARRGCITIRNRDALSAAAGGAYGIPERDYERILVKAVSNSPALARADAARPLPPNVEAPSPHELESPTPAI